MGYPPRVHHKAAHPEWDPNEPINEYIPRYECDPEQTIHFDLDPRNGKLTGKMRIAFSIVTDS